MRGASTMTKLTKEETLGYLGDSPIFGDKKSPANREDFGGPDTVGLALRRIGLSFDHPICGMDECFGKYLGQHGDRWVVATSMFDYSGVSGGEWFSSLEDLKRRWELD
jgi:hypothetical protein